MMVFALRIDTKEGLRPRLEGKSTSGGVTTKLEISTQLVTQGIYDLPTGGRRKKKNSRLKILIRANSQL